MRNLSVHVVVFLLVTAGAARAQTAAPWHLAAELRIGGGERGKVYEFSRISGVALGPNGTVIVHERKPLELRIFDATGAYVRTIGREGGGPGEYRWIGNFGFARDTLWTVDSDLRRVTLFANDGRVITTIPREPVAPSSPPRATAFFSAGPWAILANGVAIGFTSYGEAPRGTAQIPSAPILRMTLGGRTLDTIAWVSTLHSQMAFTQTVVTGLGSTSTRTASLLQPFSDTPITVVATNTERVFVVDRTAATSGPGATFGVVALRPNGDTVWAKRYAYTPKPVERASADSALAMSLDMGGFTVTRDDVRAKLFLPAFRPPVQSAFASADGALWLTRENGPGDVAYTVISADGTLVGALTVKRNVAIKAASATNVWAVELDDDDVPTVVRYRIVR